MLVFEFWWFWGVFGSGHKGFGDKSLSRSKTPNLHGNVQRHNFKRNY